MSLLDRLRKMEGEGRVISVAIVGAGSMGHGMVRQMDITPAMRTVLVVTRTVARGVDALAHSGREPSRVVVSDDERTLQRALRAGRPAVTTRPEYLETLIGIDVVVEATGAVNFGAEAARCAIAGGRHVVMMNAEAALAVGHQLHALAQAAGVVYTVCDGDQPAVMKRLVDHVQWMGFEVVAAVNCKGYLDTDATPDSIRDWAAKQRFSLRMTTSFTDGTKMNIENALLANGTGLVPEVRGMHGVRTDRAHALDDCLRAFRGRGIVDYTLGGDFGGGVFVIGFDPDGAPRHYMSYLKMGEGPYYLFSRPYHLCHMEAPVSVAEAMLDHEATLAPRGRPVADVIAFAKRNLRSGEHLDGIGGYTCYGQIDTIENMRGLLPIGLTEDAQVTRDIKKGDPIPSDAVAIREDSPVIRLQDRHQVSAT